MKLFITDHADPSVGMFPCTWEVEVPFEVGDSGVKQYYSHPKESDLVFFKEKIKEVYELYCDGRCEAYYEFEIKND